MKPKNILIATDFSVAAWRALEMAVSIAEVLRAKVHLVHAFSVVDMSSGAPPLLAMQSTELMVGERLGALVDRLHDRTCIGLVRPQLGDAAPAVLRAADELGVDLIVVGAPRRTDEGIAKPGSVAQDILQGARCPVLVAGQSSSLALPVRFGVRPPGHTHSRGQAQAIAWEPPYTLPTASTKA